MRDNPGPDQGTWSGRTVGNYEIEQRIGAGGMGEVYRARDTKLRRTVAVKAMLASAEGNMQARLRFVREVRLSSKILHPYVATVFDVIEQDESLLLVMEYIDGRPLNAVLADGPQASDKVLSWAQEITEALAAIHRAGLVHRDVKPGNVMITSDGHVKVTDFGLARVMASAEAPEGSATATHNLTLTREGAGIGTLLYMSPEQLRGDELDARSDLFSLGVLLHEALTGTHPFRRGSLPEIAGAILHEPATLEDDSAVLRRVPVLRDVLRRLLAKDREDRYANAQELLDDLRGAADRAHAVPRPIARSSWWSAVGASAAVVLALALAAFWWVRQPPEWDRPRLSLAVAPFADQAGTEESQIEAELLAHLLVTDLASSRLVRVVGPARTAATLHGLAPDASGAAIASRIASNVQADYIVIGRFYREGERYVASVEFERAGTGLIEIPALRVEGSGPLDLADRLASRIRRQLPDVTRLTALRDDRTDIVEITSASEPAREAFVAGNLAMRELKYLDAVARLEAAVGFDPGFALAWARLAEALDGLGYARRARDAATEALGLAPEGSSRAQSRLRLMLEAVHAEVFRRSDEAVEIAGSLVELFGDEPELLLRHADALRNTKRYDEAMAALDSAVTIDPLNPSLRLSRAGVLRRLGSYDEASAAIDQAESLFQLVDSHEGRAASMAARGNLLWSQRRLDEAALQLEGAAQAYRDIGREVSAVNVLLDAAKVALLQGRAAVAAEHIDTAEKLALSVGSRRVLGSALSAKAVYYQSTRDYPAAEQSYREAIDLAHQLESAELLSDPLTNLANLLAWQGRREEARPLLVEAIATAKELGRRNAQLAGAAGLGRLEVQLGDLDAAAKTYTELLEQADPDQLDRLSLRGNFGLASVNLARGNLSLALDVIDDALLALRPSNLRSEFGDALLIRATIAAQLGRHDEARSSVDEAFALARDPDAGLLDLEARCERTLTDVMFQAGEWKPAVDRALAGYVDDEPASPGSAQVVCEGLQRLGRHGEAAEYCSRHVEDEDWAVPDRVSLRVGWADALAELGQHEKAIEQARVAFDLADAAGMRFEACRAASILLRNDSLAVRPGGESLLLAANADLDAYFNAVPESDRPAVRSRYDVARIVQALDALATAE